ncbi:MULTISPECIES: hypothetical protein [Acinetobacter]|uniref:Uncharacterized protein n=1 Tax=Acinetobacter higginsii TaxID=70347 RepID=N9T3P7_9GAMM|nr:MULTISPECIES: hypothetical protein [Acinetobacter]ENX58322.1 hypothetical protein F902_02722 [Acinetobacter higginsii]
MSTIGYFQKFGLTGAKYALANIPDKTATHLGVVIDDEPTYYSLDFGSYWDNSDWQDSDFRTEAELSEAYKDGWCVDLSKLKRLVESMDLIHSNGGWNGTKNTITLFQSSLDLGLYHGVDGVDAEKEIPRLKQAVADYRAIYADGGAE